MGQGLAVESGWDTGQDHYRKSELHATVIGQMRVEVGAWWCDEGLFGTKL